MKHLSIAFVTISQFYLALSFLVPTNLEDTFLFNHKHLLHQIKKDLSDWAWLNLSWFGRASEIKIIVLHCLCYPSITVPVPDPHLFLYKTQKLFMKFLEDPKSVRISTLQSRGGLGFPDKNSKTTL
ncbi:hypothetical protein XELAEV_18008240mg [Xenopus laevis]|uniref:Uncharacterized protein n=1 Tax=Xenopus laevis TaxID=8355 RepID=A0A974E3C2_XENLA|nr:hypothetical protein XELAEV_18008240mg [Xenopus laevis]